MAVAAGVRMAAEAEAAAAAAIAVDLAGATGAVLADEADVAAALTLAAAAAWLAAKAGRGSLRFRGSLGGMSGTSVPCGSGCRERDCTGNHF